ncbi:hypothetical protein [Bradyrhizobium diazoefficiens]|nr:hypothetical protein XF15B_05840 [Bradyrhizobium diazoefficiens]
MTTASQTRSHKLASRIVRFEEANAAHDRAKAMERRAVALDLALEREAAEHGFEFEEIVLAWQVAGTDGQPAIV